MPLIPVSAGVPVLRIHRQRGSAMFGTVMAMIVSSMMLVMLAQWMNSANDDLRAKRNADSLLQFSQAAGHYLDANREAIMRVANAESVAAGTAEAQIYCVVSLNGSNRATFDPYMPSQATHGRGTCAVDAQWLVSRSLLPGGFALTNPYGQKWVAIYRLVYADYDNDNNAVTPNTTQYDVEMLVVATAASTVAGSSRPTPNNELGMTVQLVGGIAGMFPDTAAAPVAGCTTGRVCGPGGWQVQLSDFDVTYQP